jgi:hypothetical protein
MATGENTTTWGNVTNINLGTAVEEAIVGSADVAFSNANVTLTLTDTNAAQTARNLRLNLTGTATSGYNLVVPSIEKVYLINNGTDGAITVKNTTGTGIAVPAGKTMWVYNNGTNVVDAVTHLTSLTLASPLPVASGGTGGNTAAAARTALELGTISTQNANAVAITGGSISGITDLAVADGGTGASTNSAARVNLLPSYTGNNSKVLAVNAGETDTEWVTITPGTGTVTSVNGVGTVNGISLTGSVSTTGNLTLGGALTGVNLSTQVTGTLPVANGGTGSSSASGARTNLGIVLVPAGAVVSFAMNTAPTGYLKCDGSAVSRSTYADLFTAIGTTFGSGNGSTTFNLPELRGEFVRGWDDGRGIDSGRAFGSAQGDQFGAHTHTYQRNIDGGSGQPGGSGGSLSTLNTGSAGGITNSSETRPRNIALLYCIKT